MEKIVFIVGKDISKVCWGKSGDNVVGFWDVFNYFYVGSRVLYLFLCGRVVFCKIESMCGILIW